MFTVNIYVKCSVKGKYLPFAENDNKFHHTILTKSLYDEGLKSIDDI